MNKKILSKDQPIEPYIEPDGWYTRCFICWSEVTPKDKECSKCGQAQDWSWFGKGIVSNKNR